jgi:hypothetical protein
MSHQLQVCSATPQSSLFLTCCSVRKIARQKQKNVRTFCGTFLPWTFHPSIGRWVHLHGSDDNGDTPLHVALRSRDLTLESVIMRMVGLSGVPLLPVACHTSRRLISMPPLPPPRIALARAYCTVPPPAPAQSPSSPRSARRVGLKRTMLLMR